MTCIISQQIAEYCDEEESICECGEELTEVHSVEFGEYLECEHCGWHNVKDEGE